MNIIKKCLIHLFENIIKSNRITGAIMLILTGIAVLIWPIFHIVGWNTPNDTTIKEVSSYGSAALLVIICLIYLPVKRHEEQESKHQGELKIKQDEQSNLIIANAKLVSYLKTEHAKEIDGLKSEIQKLVEEKDNRSKINVLAAMAAHGHDGKIIKVKVINHTNYLIKVERVGIMLEPRVATIGGVAAMRSDLSVPAIPREPMEIKPNGDGHTWQYVCMDFERIQFHKVGADWLGKGFVVLSDERKFYFEFKKI